MLWWPPCARNAFSKTFGSRAAARRALAAPHTLPAGSSSSSYACFPMVCNAQLSNHCTCDTVLPQVGRESRDQAKDKPPESEFMLTPRRTSSRVSASEARRLVDLATAASPLQTCTAT